MKRRSFFAVICAVLGFRLMPTQPSVCRQPTCDRYGFRHAGWHTQYLSQPLRSPAKPHTATDVLRYRDRYLTDTHAWYLKVEPPPETRWLYIDR